MIKQRATETRINYLIRVLEIFMENTLAGEEMIEYDDAECDGQCLYEDIKNELLTLKVIK